MQIAQQLVGPVHDHPLVLDLGERRRQTLPRRGRNAQPRAEVGATHPHRDRDVEQVEQRRRDVEQLDGTVDHVRGDPGDRDDERNPGLPVVQRRAVVAPAVFVELLAVIGGEDDDRIGLSLAHGRDQASDRRVGVGDLAVVAIDVAVAEREALALVVGLVRLEEVHPDERAPRLHLVVVSRDLLHPPVGVDVLELHVFEIEVRLRVALQLVRVDEEHRRAGRTRPSASRTSAAPPRAARAVRRAPAARASGNTCRSASTPPKTTCAAPARTRA